MESAVPMTVLMRDPDCASAVRSAGSVRVLRTGGAAAAAHTPNAFVLTLASGLSDVAEFVREANRRRVLRALLVHVDVEPRWVAQMLDRADLRTLRNLLVHRGAEVPRRILRAWQMGAQDDLIADATIIHDRLLVLSCALERIEIPFGRLRALSGIPANARPGIAVADDGSYVHWPGVDVHLDLEAVRVALDPNARDRALRRKIVHDRRFGLAVAKLRKARELHQSDVSGVSARQLRRIEAGEFMPRVATLKRMAAAHGMNLADYLDALAEAG